MPPNKPKQDHAEKSAEIVAAARELLVTDGYDATSMTRIAQNAGVATNTIYWYFRDKDAVLLAVLNAVLADSADEYREMADQPIADLVLWLVATLEKSDMLITAVHSRVSHSDELDAWHTQFHRTTEDAFRRALERAGAPADTIDAEIQIGIFAIEGILTHELTDAQKRAVCESLTARWSPALA